MSANVEILPVFAHPTQRSRLKSRRVIFILLGFTAFLALLSWRHQLYESFLLSPPTLASSLQLAENQSVAKKPGLTSLGLEADESYKLGSTSPPYYHASLDNFLSTAFPSHLHPRLQEHLDLYFSSDPQTKSPERPKLIWQTNRELTENRRTNSWSLLNNGYTYRFLTDGDADEWVRSNFKGSDIEWTWDHLPQIVMKTDFLRYLVLFVEGGVYSDIDTTCLKPISRWGYDPNIRGEPRGGEQPAAIIGIEADVGGREDWHKWWSRPVQFVQWTLDFSPGHPILLDTIKRIHDKTHQAQEVLGGALQDIPNEYLADSVVEWTGPAMFTDAVFRFLEVESGLQWPELRGLKKPLRVGTVTILPVTGFSPGVGNFGAQGSDHPEAMVLHDFKGSWKPKKNSRK